MKLNEFLSRHAVFTVDELDRFLSERGSGKTNTRKSLLTYHLGQGRIVRVRRGLFATVPLGADSASSPVDTYLVAAKMTADAVFAYHTAMETAMEFHGKAYSLYTKLIYISASKSLPLKFRSNEIRGVSVPNPLRAKGEEMFGVTCHKRSGVDLRVTNLERSFVDVLDRPDSTRKLGRDMADSGIGRVLRPGSGHRVHSLVGERDYRRQGGFLLPRQPRQCFPEKDSPSRECLTGTQAGSGG